MLARLRTWITVHKRHAPAAALVAGLLWDSATLGRPDELYGNLVLLFYILVSGVSIVLMSRREHRKREPSLWLLLVTQFSFGNLTSGLLVLYTASATFVGNWLFLLLLVALLIGSEVFRNQYERLRFNVAVYYLLVFSYLVLLVPVLARTIEAWTFLVSGVLSLAVISLFLFLLRTVAREAFSANRKQLVAGIAAVFIVFNIFYYFNVIPPVPLSAREVGIFHKVERSGETYLVSYERGRWYEFWKRSDSGFHLGASGRAYCYSSIFAPADLSTPVYHVWEEYDAQLRAWKEREKISFPIHGGRDGGYRGYSIKTVDAGVWRCSVETERGAILGRTEVTVIPGAPVPELTVEVR